MRRHPQTSTERQLVRRSRVQVRPRQGRRGAGGQGHWRGDPSPLPREPLRDASLGPPRSIRFGFWQAAIAKKHDSHSVSSIRSSIAPRSEGGVAEVNGVEELGKDLAAEEARREKTKVGQEVADEETRKPRICRRPLAPTEEMVEEHNRTHAEYRDWCPDCRAGKSTGLHHRRGDLDEEKLGPPSVLTMRSDSRRSRRTI